jgi:ketosteroid isomerase-like protein
MNQRSETDMTAEEQLALVKKHYDVNRAGDWDAAAELITDDFVITIPSYMPFGGTYRGKTAFQELIPAVANSVRLAGMEYLATTVGDGYAIELVEFTLAGAEDSPTLVSEVVWFRGRQICEIRPFYADYRAFVDAAARRKEEESR